MGFSEIAGDEGGMFTGAGRVSVVIRRLDRETLACLQQRARCNARSVEAEMRLILTRAVAGMQAGVEAVPSVPKGPED